MGTLVTGTAATYVEELWIKTDKRYEIMCITQDVQNVIKQSGITDGIVLVNPMHITASCYVNDLEFGPESWTDNIIKNQREVRRSV